VKSVHVEADVDEAFKLDETPHLLTLADLPDNALAGVVACGRPEREDFRTYLDKIIGHAKLKGIRRVLHTQPDEVGQSETFVHNIGSLADYGLAFDLCVLASQFPIAIKLALMCKDVIFISRSLRDPTGKRKEFLIPGVRTSRKSRSFRTCTARFPDGSPMQIQYDGQKTIFGLTLNT
jgi:hypothetical protein